MSNYYKDADDTKAEGTNDIGEPENCLYYIVILILLKICCLYFFKIFSGENSVFSQKS